MSAFATLPLLTHGPHEWGHAWWPLWTLFWAALIGTAVWLLLRRRERRPLDRAHEVLAERFARGELSGDEYRQRLDELHRRGPAA